MDRLSNSESVDYEVRQAESCRFFGPNIGNLFAKLSRVMGEVSRVPKRGRNEFHGYDYMTEADLTDAIRPKLSAEGIAIIFSAGQTEHHPYQTAKGKPTFLTTVTCQVMIGDSEGNVIIVTTSGVGADEGDKGAYKAQTGALKYLLYKSFLVSTNDDPEDDANDKRRAEAPKQRTNGKAAAPPVSAIGAPSCPTCNGPMDYVESGVSAKTGKPYGAFWSCENRECVNPDTGKRSAIKDADWQAMVR